MCGICGFIGFEDVNFLKEMCKILYHRGIDDEGSFTCKDASLGQRRLSIIDLKKGLYPLHNENNDIFVVFNGEIYNYKKLKLKLTKHKFYSDCDGETIVHAYEEFGEKFVEYLEGQFAIALWDAKNKKLILARDRMGVKPLYYWFDGKRLVFSSEIKALLLYPAIKREIDYFALGRYFDIQFYSAEQTFFKDIKKLMPGYLAVFQNSKLELKNYWDFKMNAELKSEQEYTYEIREMIKKSVEERLVADVPIGAFLSGGIDSSTIVAIMSKLDTSPVKTFSVGFKDSSDELPYARQIAEMYGTDHQEIIVDAKEVIETFPKIIWHYDEPTSDPTTIPMYLISQIAKKKVSVVLSGEGGDELFAGYTRHKMLTWPIPESIKKILYSKYFSAFRYTTVWEESAKKKLFTPETYFKLTKEKTPVNFLILPHKDLLTNALYYDMKIWIQNDLQMIDRTTLAHSLECRAPYVENHNFVELSTKIPNEFKVKGPYGKYIFKKAIADLLPKNLLVRKKRGFSPPLHTWFNSGLGEVVMPFLEDSTLFKPDFAKKIYEKQKTNKISYPRLLWMIGAAEIWKRMFIDGEKIKF